MKLILIIGFSLICFCVIGQTDQIIGSHRNCIIEIYLIKDTNKDTSSNLRYFFKPETKNLNDTSFIKNIEILGLDTSNNKIKILLSKDCFDRLMIITRDRKFPLRTPFAILINGKPEIGGWFLNSYVSNFYSCDWIHIFFPLDRYADNCLNLEYIDRLKDKIKPLKKIMIDCLDTKR
jgi:hypothetical protein